MMKRKHILSSVLLFLLICMMAFPAHANGWVKTKSGTYTYVSKAGKKIAGTYFPSYKLGIVKVNKYYYCFRENGQGYIGILNIGKVSWYFSTKNGRMLTGLQKLDGSYYYFSPKNGRAVKNVVQKIGNYYYRFDATGKGVRLKSGLKKIGGVYYYYVPGKGTLLKNKVK